MSEKNKGGRPKIVLSEEQRKELETLAAVLSTEQIADYFGISRRVFFDIIDRDEEVSALYKKGKAKAVGFVAQNLIQKAKNDSKGLDVVRNSNIIITIPCGNYTTLAESIKQKREQDFENILRELIKKV